MVYPDLDLTTLTVGERLALIEQVWDSLRRSAGVLPLSDRERDEIETRRAVHRQGPTAAIPWENVRADLLADQDTDEQSGEGNPCRAIESQAERIPRLQCGHHERGRP